ncbi:MAG: serine hydrolase [Pseudomonadales bacterium]|nr:beta-lactamase family protein [Pseudomonadales bacterium]NIX06787.1 serine hydrolase [Pseudomonadales bacterium]
MTVDTQGHCDPAFGALRDTFVRNFDEGLETGASLAVTHQGSNVVDLWAGYADAANARPWQSDTLVQVYSTTKIMVVVCVLKLIDEGLIELEAPVARYWPEFGQAGKSDITIKQVIVHQSGVPGFDPPQPYEVFSAWERVTAAIAKQPPMVKPGTSCYHPMTYGFILGEVTRRVTGLMLSEFFRQEFAEPLSADFHIGMTDRADFDRVADEVNRVPVGQYWAPDSLGRRVVNSMSTGEPGTWAYATIENPAANGYGNARSIARVGAMLAMGGALEGHRYLSEKIVRQAATEQSFEEDLLWGPLRMGIGFGLHADTYPAPTPSCFHWGGFGGSWLVMDLNSGLSCAYAMNQFTPLASWDEGASQDPRQTRFWNALGPIVSRLAQSTG